MRAETRQQDQRVISFVRHRCRFQPLLLIIAVADQLCQTGLSETNADRPGRAISCTPNPDSVARRSKPSEGQDKSTDQRVQRVLQ